MHWTKFGVEQAELKVTVHQEREERMKKGKKRRIIERGRDKGRQRAGHGKEGRKELEDI